jgi:putative isomerase
VTISMGQRHAAAARRSRLSLATRHLPLAPALVAATGRAVASVVKLHGAVAAVALGIAWRLLTPSLALAQSSEISRLFAQIHAKENVVKPPNGILKHEYLVPAGPYFQLFDWDMYFMGVALSYDRVGEPVAGSIEDFLEFVDEYANWPGYTPREIAPDALWALPEMCKPFLAQAAVRASRTTGDYRWLSQPNGESKKTNFAKLADTLAFWENTRRAPDGFFLWYNGVESGVDNNPAVSDNPAQVTEGVDLQCYLYREYRAMAVLAKKLGMSPEAASYKGKADDLQARLRAKMWSDADGMFLNVDARTGKFVEVKTWTNFVPLWAGIATRDQADRMIKSHVLNPREFWCDDGLRTLAPGEPLYDAKAGYWRGPVWVISNYLVMHGLMNYGYHGEARELAERTVNLLVRDIKSSGGMNENYDPDNGQPAAGGHFLSWNLLAEHMVEEAGNSTDPTALQ